MAAIPSLQKIRDTVRGNIMAENLANQSNGNPKPLHNAIAVVPESTMWRLITWLHEIVLPKIELHRGKESDDYKNHVGIRDAVIWALYIGQQYERGLVQRQQDRQLLGYYIEQNAFLERELQKYTTVEELATHETYELYRQSLVSKALAILNEKK